MWLGFEVLPQSGRCCEVLAPCFVEDGHHLLVGACFFFFFFGISDSPAASVKGCSSSRTGWEGMPGWREGCFADRNIDRQMVKISVALNALIRRSLSIKSRFPFTPGSTMRSAALQNALRSSCCLVLWLSLPAARPYRSESLWDDLHAQASACGWV